MYKAITQGAGVERSYEKELRGEGVEILLRDAWSYQREI